VDGKTVHEPGTIVREDCCVVLDSQAKNFQKNLLTILLHKPIGYVSSQPEKHYRPAASLIQRKNRYNNRRDSAQQRIQWPINGLAPAGRLDIDSTGLLVLTQDGRIAKQLIAAQSDIEKEYLVRVDRAVKTDAIQQMTFGLSLDGVKLAPARIALLDWNYFRMILTEGRKRQIRRMCEQVGLQVVGLKRVRIGNVKLGSLPLGRWRLLGQHESF